VRGAFFEISNSSPCTPRQLQTTTLFKQQQHLQISYTHYTSPYTQHIKKQTITMDFGGQQQTGPAPGGRACYNCEYFPFWTLAAHHSAWADGGSGSDSPVTCTPPSRQNTLLHLMESSTMLALHCCFSDIRHDVVALAKESSRAKP
jgi:hypothetical protein